MGNRLWRLPWYPEGESNSYLKFRKLLFYPLNYRGVLQRYAFFLKHHALKLNFRRCGSTSSPDAL